MKKLLHTYKYSGAFDIAQTITDLILKNLKPVTIKTIKKNINSFTSIPLHSDKLRKRGFNQSHLIAKEIARQLEIPYEKNLLVRKYDTTAQAKLNRSERIKNMQGVFEINPLFDVENLNVLIFDDVVTTYSTLNNAAKALKKAKAKNVWGFTIAR